MPIVALTLALLVALLNHRLIHRWVQDNKTTDPVAAELARDPLYGTRQQQIEWLRSYLQERTQDQEGAQPT